MPCAPDKTRILFTIDWTLLEQLDACRATHLLRPNRAQAIRAAIRAWIEKEQERIDNEEQ